ncbi:transposase [Hallella multisaccharivorax]|uniref:transposase n=1 Tax=Hallella multisaccharivorax TaxID=310514 RepID=UPI0009FBDC49
MPQSGCKKCLAKGWGVYSRPPAKVCQPGARDIGRYAYRVAISNSRVLDYTSDDMVTYDWKNYRQGGKHCKMTMKAVDFLNLFSLHILRPSFGCIRHYGILSSSNRDKVRKVQVWLGETPVPKYRKKKPYCRSAMRKAGR